MLIGKRQVATKAAYVTSQHFADGAQLFEGRISLATLHATNIAGIGIRLQRENLL